MGTFARTGFVKVNGHAEVAQRKSESILSSGSQVRVLPSASVGGGSQGRHRPCISLRRIRRLVLRTLGVPFHLQDTFLDTRRWSVTVTNHAISQAGERYRQGDPKYIVRDVIDALCCSRLGDRTPDNRHGSHRSSRLVWNEDVSRVYVLKRAKRGWLVVTALPTAWSDAAAASRAAAATGDCLQSSPDSASEGKP